ALPVSREDTLIAHNSTPYCGSSSNAWQHLANDSGTLSTCPVGSQGLRAAPNSGTTLLSTLVVASVGCGIGTPWRAAMSAEMMPAPPEPETTATPFASGLPAAEKNLAVSTNASKSSTATKPARSKSARKAAPEPASEPVCERAAAAPSSDTPIL